jgi:hypothetical protein
VCPCGETCNNGACVPLSCAAGVCGCSCCGGE